LQDIASIIDVKVSNIGDPHYDDPSLALLFRQLKLKTLQTAKGTSEISGRTEFKFVLQIARVFCRMGIKIPCPLGTAVVIFGIGCHVLALDLVRSWSFARPAVPRTMPPGANFGLVPAPSPTAARHSQFGINAHARRQSSILIDMEVPSDPSTRRASPVPSSESMTLGLDRSEEKTENESDLFARKAGMGNLLKSAKQNVQVPEFDMNSFF
jgi:RAVE protein 1 C terminal